MGEPHEDFPAGSWVWNGKELAKTTSVPVSVGDNGRFYLSLLSFAKVYSDHVSETNTVIAPPVTSTIILASSFFYFQPDGVSLRRAALCPQRIVQKRQLGRLLLSPLMHVDKAHFLTTLSMFLPDAVEVEKKDGSGLFVVDFLSMLLLTQGIYVGWAWYDNKVASKPQQFHSVGSVGLGPVAMAIKVAAAHSNEGVSWVLGTVPVPAFLACWAELALTQILLPEQNIRANLAGITAGLIRCLALEPALKMIARRRKKRRITDEAWLEDYQPNKARGSRVRGVLRFACRAVLQLALTAAGARACQEVEQRLVRIFRRRPLSQWNID